MVKGILKKKKKVMFTKCTTFKIYIKDEDQLELTGEEQMKLRSICSADFKRKLNSYRQCGKSYHEARRNGRARRPMPAGMHQGGDPYARRRGRGRRRHVRREPVSSWPVRFARGFLRHVRTFFEI